MLKLFKTKEKTKVFDLPMMILIIHYPSVYSIKLQMIILYNKLKFIFLNNTELRSTNLFHSWTKCMLSLFRPSFEVVKDGRILHYSWF